MTLRLRFKATDEQRAYVRERLARLQQPGALLALLQDGVGEEFNPASIACVVQSVHPDRFVLRVAGRTSQGEPRAYALKAFSDDFGERIWDYSRALEDALPPHQGRLCLPIKYLSRERALLFPWVEGTFLSEIVDERKPALLREAAEIAADLHRLPLVPDTPTTSMIVLVDTLARCDRLRTRWPETTLLIRPLMALLEDAERSLDPPELTPVHGDLAAGQFLWTGERLVLLDLDMFGYADPAYDVGHFLGQLERRRVVDSSLPAGADGWLACFREAYGSAMPAVLSRNVTFYAGLTLVRKIYTVCRRQLGDWRRLVPQLAAEARATLQEVVSVAAA